MGSTNFWFVSGVSSVGRLSRPQRAEAGILKRPERGWRLLTPVADCLFLRFEPTLRPIFDELVNVQCGRRVLQDIILDSSNRLRREMGDLESLLHQGPIGAVFPGNDLGIHSGLILCVRFQFHQLYHINYQIGQYVR